MPAIKVSDLKVGQKFESDVKFNNGTVLFKATEIILFKHIKALKAWGFTEVAVVEAQIVTQDKDISGNVLTNDATIERLFSKTNLDDPVVIELKRISRNLKDSPKGPHHE